MSSDQTDLSHLTPGSRIVPAAIFAVSVSALAFALISQYGFGLQPCELCIWQRWPYVAAALFGFAAALGPFSRYARVTLVIAAGLAFLTGAGIAGYHAGVEYGWWAGLPGCSGAALSSDVRVEDLQAALAGQDRIVACDEPAFIFAGLSMAGWNFVLSLLLTAGTVWALVTRRAG
ncbi:disulfide bond formation protein B [Rhodovibrio salinarum]|uniref:Disulfide bond formation protein B n=1 Tax=Rhodovibrio salinarum TaxID=1087 RepID=A0A934UZ51_9PROT|nr:disulfide bond formation protein B [Rhodovibrio salinarum]MBK1695995.1 disulfide bond formation protein B [Rhodovibrio salinarum]